MASAGPAKVSARGDPTRGAKPIWESGGQLSPLSVQDQVAQKVFELQHLDNT